MNGDRRAFFSAGLAAAWAAGHTASAWSQEPVKVDSANGESARIDGLTCLDYGRSFICNTAAFNSVRFWIESRTVLFDGERRVEFYQCGSCKSENTFAERDLFIEDNYDFLPILGEGHWLIFRRTARLNPNYRQIKTVEAMWGAPDLKLREAKRVRTLDTWDAIREASASAAPLVARTALRDEQTGLSAVIECPIKTMNISLDKQMYQVDTGPVALPDLSRRYAPAIDCLRLAFVAFNAPHFADFIVEQPTPVIENGQTLALVHHYSGPFTLAAKNLLLAIEDA